MNYYLKKSFCRYAKFIDLIHFQRGMLYLYCVFLLPQFLKAQVDCSNVEWDIGQKSVTVTGVGAANLRTFSTIGVEQPIYLDVHDALTIKKDITGNYGLKGEVNSGGKIELSVYLQKDDGGIQHSNLLYRSYVDATTQGWVENSEEYAKENWENIFPFGSGAYAHLSTSHWASTNISQSISYVSMAQVNEGFESLTENKKLRVVIQVKIQNATFFGFKIPGLDIMQADVFDLNPVECETTSAPPTETASERIMRLFKNPLDYPNYTIVAAHRGYWKDVPENTLAAYDRTIATGADMVELDVRYTQDKKLVVFHDKCLDRITNGTGYLSDITWGQAQNLFLKDRYGNLTNYKMASLEDVLTHLKDKILINFDIKERNSTANPDAFWEAMEASIALANSIGVLDQLIIKAKYSPNSINTQLAKGNITLSDLIYTPVAFGWDTPNMDTYVDSYINMKDISSIELTYKTDYDPILAKIAPTINNGVRVGTYSFWPEECGGVWSEDFVTDPNNFCVANGRDYNFFYESTGSAIVGDPYASDTDSGSPANAVPTFLNDGRGDWDWIMKYGANFIITDRPTLMIDYLKKRGLRDDNSPLITEFKLDSITATIKNSNPVATNRVKFEGIGRKIRDYREAEFFVPDTRQDCVDCELLNNTTYSNGKTQAWCESLIATSGTCTCEDIYGTPTYPDAIPYGTDLSTLSEADIRKYPLHTLPEWSKIYDGYDIYINTNFFDVKDASPISDPSSRVTVNKYMYQTPCTDVFGMLKPNSSATSTFISNDYEPSDPISDQFDALYWLESGEIKMVPYGESDPYENISVLGVTGFILAENGVAADLSNMASRQKDVPKKRTVIAIDGYEMVVLNTTTQVTPGDIVTYLITEHSYKDVFMFDAGGSSQMLSSTGMYPNRDIVNDAGPGITSSNIPRDLNLNNERVFRPIPTFLAIKAK